MARPRRARWPSGKTRTAICICRASEIAMCSHKPSYGRGLAETSSAPPMVRAATVRRLPFGRRQRPGRRHLAADRTRSSQAVRSEHQETRYRRSTDSVREPDAQTTGESRLRHSTGRPDWRRLREQARLAPVARPQQSPRHSTAPSKSIPRPPRCVWFRLPKRSSASSRAIRNASLNITVEINAEFPSGASDQIKRAVTENATSLGFKNKGLGVVGRCSN